ncbi:MAG: NAD(P)-dependent oxidoreductase [Candidatus Omnitrophota bacterium]|jgi:GDP-L-fucose synthase|nr:NAD(P)-dependent oxidoreductase [Candidatus Omnitrophota bacterium]MDD5518584.1 NAD(P)-dependent oxidoreductase [Candidatus Omnitrophota bacterium]
MSILITGSGGFVGRNLAESFSKDKYSVLSPSKAELDLTKPDAIGRYFKKNRIETIIHCATTSRKGASYPVDTCENNLRMFFNLEKHMTPSMKMINLGSGSEYARSHWHKKMPEEYFGKYVPEDSHGYSKYLISKYIQDANRENLFCFRIFGIFGKHEDYRYKFISNSIVKNLLGLPIIINQNVIYDYLYINDLYEILVFFVNNKTKKKIFNITPAEPIDLVAIARLINKISGNKCEIKVLNPGIGVEYSGDNKRLLSEIGKFKFIAYEKAIADLFGYYKKIKDTLDVDAIKRDLYLNYAKELRKKYFIKNQAKWRKEAKRNADENT